MAEYIYGLEALDTDTVKKAFILRCDKELDDTSRDELVQSLARTLGVQYDAVNEALFLYTNEDGTPAQIDDLYEEIDGPTQPERMANLEALQEEADEECAEELGNA